MFFVMAVVAPVVFLLNGLTLLCSKSTSMSLVLAYMAYAAITVWGLQRYQNGNFTC